MPGSRTTLARELRAVRAAFQNLAQSFSRLGPVLLNATEAAETAPAADAARTRRRPRLTSKQRAALKLQGKYMGTMRGLPAAKRAQVKKIRAKKGIRAAITAAMKMAS